MFPTSAKPATKPGRLVLNRYVPGLLTWVSNKMSSGASRVYRERFDLGVTDWRVLAYLGVEPTGTNAAICQLIGLDKAAVSRSVAILKKGGLVRSRPVAGRTVELTITAKGCRVYDRVLRLALTREETMLTGFDAAERELLIQFLHRVLVNVTAMNAVDVTETNR
ncbi:DNA-binding MarR family transcriptional regulator [Humitalea rosea]|uniref:DNA-binding MarR family transcriptional regulator n=1 Tax=Humitalea rosea TaxID=990373 RepID=A0A2W7HW44_9PROT|nr:MarR family winged helix-turn-helix transcriptional regulator [Humitalea rosea]PZW37585.1 DNA-binding MarR family transcriptional regulator [Humitalea rosea]